MNIFEYYDIDEYGVIVRKDTGKIIKQYKNDNGYMKAQLTINGLNKKVRVHRMVCMKYLANPMGYAYVNHKDGDKTNNHVSNLEWCTSIENSNHAIRIGLSPVGADRYNAKLSTEDVLNIRKRRANGETQTGIYKDYKDRIGWWGFRDVVRGSSYKSVIL